MLGRAGRVQEYSGGPVPPAARHDPGGQGIGLCVSASRCLA
jgi:hypothetical protein